MRGRVTLPILLAAVAVCAQENVTLEIRGIVTEVGPNTGIIDARTTVYQFSKNSERSVLATGTTDSRGNFEFHPEQPGNYYVEVMKPGYLAGSPEAMRASATNVRPGGRAEVAQETGALVTVDRDHPREYVRLALMQATELSGRVLDGDEKPVAGLFVEALDGDAPGASLAEVENVRATTYTELNGSFRVSNLRPGRYLIRVSSTSSMRRPVMAFTDEDLNKVSEHVATEYWPGVRDAAAAGKVTLTPGTPTDAGTIHVRKEPLYRVRVSMGGCQVGNGLQFSIIGSTAAQVAVPWPLSGCGDFLVQNLPEGSYEFALQDKESWALAPVNITNKNLSLTMSIVPDGEVSGVFVAAYEGMQLPALNYATVRLEPLHTLQFLHPMPLVRVSNGKFLFKGVRGVRHIFSVGGLGNGYYVKEIRSDGVLQDGVVTAGPGSRIEIVLDDQPATLSGTVTDGEKRATRPQIYLSRWPPAAAPSPARAIATPPTATGDNDGKFQIAGLAPGEYKMVALPSGPVPDGASEWGISPGVWERAETVMLERGKTSKVIVELTDPVTGN
jgi:hypothetical protein